MEILEACGYHPEIGIKVLRQKTLLTVVDGRFDMHDLVQEMGHYIVRGKHPRDPQKHSRVWKHEEIEDMCFQNATMENNKIRAIEYYGYHEGCILSSSLSKIVSNMKKLRFLSVWMRDEKDDEGPTFLSNELLYMAWGMYPSRSPFPDSFQPTKLVVLKLDKSKQKELWKGCKRLLNLKVLKLRTMMELLNTPDFNGLPSLLKLRLDYCWVLEEIHPSFENHRSLEYLHVVGCRKLRMFPTIAHMKNLKTLEIRDCKLKDGDIGSGIGELSSLQELDLSGNGFSRLDFSISQLTCLKVLNLSWCAKLTKLPKLPSSLVILEAGGCKSLTTIGDCHINCKWLRLVTLEDCNIVNGGGRLLQSMLEGNAIESGSMLILQPGIEIAKGFTPRLLRGSRYILKCPETSWCDDFLGFLICVVSIANRLHITVKKVRSCTYSVDNGEESDGDIWKPPMCEVSEDISLTCVWYVSFGSLKHTVWWDQIQTCKYLQFDIESDHAFRQCFGLGVRLIAKKSGSGVTETSTNSSTDYTPNITIEHDSASTLTFSTEGLWREREIEELLI